MYDGGLCNNVATSTWRSPAARRASLCRFRNFSCRSPHHAAIPNQICIRCEDAGEQVSDTGAAAGAGFPVTGQTLQTDEENLAELGQIAADFQAKAVLPVLRGLRVA
jgi:hypothetical protein